MCECSNCLLPSLLFLYQPLFSVLNTVPIMYSLLSLFSSSPPLFYPLSYSLNLFSSSPLLFLFSISAPSGNQRGGTEDVLRHPWFSKIDFNACQNKTIKGTHLHHHPSLLILISQQKGKLASFQWIKFQIE